MCPKCNEPLLIMELHGVEVDHCLECRGTWFDHGELELISELAGVAPGQVEAAVHAAGQGAKTRYRCPRCVKKLRAVNIGQPPIEVDVCPDGEGIWLDAGELADIVRLLSDGGDDAAIAEFFGDLFRHELTGQAEEE